MTAGVCDGHIAVERGVQAARSSRRSFGSTFGQGGIVRRQTIMAIWIGGLVLAAILYAIGPDRFFGACLDLVAGIDTWFRGVVAALGAQAYGVVRALAIAIYLVFAVLAFAGSHRGYRGMGALIAVTVVFLALVWRPYDVWPVPIGRWMAALILSVVGAVVMSQRLSGTHPLTGTPSGRSDRPPPYPPGGRS